eukprot:scaffold266814_cov56-Attheya_sp.AAC.2
MDAYVTLSLQELAIMTDRDKAVPEYNLFVEYHNDPNYADKWILNSLRQVEEQCQTTSGFHYHGRFGCLGPYQFASDGDNCHGIVVETEEFRVDPALEYQNEIAMADAIVKDMDLPNDFTPGLATAIVEQEQLPPVTNNNVPPLTIAVAWSDSKENSNAMEGLITHQFPPPPAYQKK